MSESFFSRNYFYGCKVKFLLYIEIKEDLIMLSTVLIVILIILLIGAFPGWSYSRNWGYYPFGGLGVVLLIIIILLLMGRI